MSYSQAWVENQPTTTTTANTIWLYWQNNQVAIRERLDGLFGTTNFASADPYKAITFNMGGSTLATILPGSVGFAITNYANSATNFLMDDSGNAAFAGALTVGGATTLSSYSGGRIRLTHSTNAQLEVTNGTDYILLTSQIIKHYNTGIPGYFSIIDAYYNSFWFEHQSTGSTSGRTAISHGSFGIGGYGSSGTTFSVLGLPTSSAGLITGDVWNSAGTLKIV